MTTSAANEGGLTEEDAWVLLRRLAGRARRGDPVVGSSLLDAEGRGVQDEGEAVLQVGEDEPRAWRPARAQPTPDSAARELLDLYMPLCVGRASRDCVVGHLGQSLDGRIATRGGVSQFITGPENVEHSHRMRALFDAVLVGAKTVERDDPRLTTRRVPGDHPTRVVLDPTLRLGTDYQVFRDEAAPTVLLCTLPSADGTRHGEARVFCSEDSPEGALSPQSVLDLLRQRGLRRVFIEGGGITVSAFLRARALDRLHVAVAPVILGSGRPAFSLPEIQSLDEALSFECRHFVTGRDVLFDCALGRPAPDPPDG